MLEEPKQKSANALHLFKMLIDVNEKILKGTSYESILDFLFEKLHVVIPYDRIGIALLEKNGNSYGLKMNWVKSRGSTEHLNLPYFASTISSSLQNVLDSNEPRIINDLNEYLAKHPTSVPTQLIIKDGIQSSLTCPVKFNNKAIGVIFFSSSKVQTYLQEHVETFQQIASEISVVINHGKLQRCFDKSEMQNRNVNMTLHDLKSPLGVLQGFAEISLERPWFQNLEPEAKLVFQTFFKNTKYMIQLVNDLSEIAFLNAENDRCEIKENNLAEFLEEIVQTFAQMAQQKEIALQNSYSPLLLPVTASFDSYKLKRVLLNLISNAIKFSKRKSKIIFKADLVDDRLIFSVEDQGPGIPENEFGKLFHEFGKTSVLPTEGEVSTGQGLAIAKKIIDQHHGQISVTSTIGKGSTFSFWIPACSIAKKSQSMTKSPLNPMKTN